MTQEIRCEQASLEHMTKQPRGLRYALFCDEVLKRTLGGLCASQSKLGHLGNYEDYSGAKADALTHPHAALIRFYPDGETKPSQDFLNDLRKKLTK